MGLEEGDIQPMLDQMGIDAVSGGITARVLVDQISKRLVPPEAPRITGRVVRLTMKTGAFPLAIGTAIAINTTQLLARYFRAIQDGAATEIYCEVT